MGKKSKNQYFTELPKLLKKEGKKHNLKFTKSFLKVIDDIAPCFGAASTTEAQIGIRNEKIEFCLTSFYGVPIILRVDEWFHEVEMEACFEELSFVQVKKIGADILSRRFIKNDIGAELFFATENLLEKQLRIRHVFLCGNLSKELFGSFGNHLLHFVGVVNQISEILVSEKYQVYSVKFIGKDENFNSLGVMKIVCNCTGIGISEAKRLIESFPVQICFCGSPMDEELIKQALRKYGAKVE